MRRALLIAIIVVGLAAVPAAHAQKAPLKLTSLNFAAKPVGSTSIGVITTTNKGPEPVLLSAESLFSFTGGFSLSGAGDSCHTLLLSGAPLEPGQSCRAEIQFAPPTTGVFTGTFCIDAQNQSYCVVVRGVAVGRS